MKKGVVAFPMTTGWYAGAFFIGNGGTLFGPNANDAAAGIQFGGDAGVAAANYMIDLAANPNFRNDADGLGNAGLKDGTVAAYFSGDWEYSGLYEAARIDGANVVQQFMNITLPYMNMAMIINLFPGVMSMVAIYFLLKAMGLTEGSNIPIALVISYCAGAGTGFYVMKGYMDTIPKALDEAAYLDGATKWQTFTKITLSMCKPMIACQVITAFMGPWMDFIFAKIIVRAEAQYYTVSIGQWRVLEMEYIGNWFTRFCAGAVLVAIPIAILFMITQKFYQEAMSGSVRG